jgi:hypothetical protein
LRIGIRRVLFGASLLAAASPAAAAPYDLAYPRVDPSWGGRPGMPTAPSAAVAADTELPTTLSGADRTAEYVRRMLASPATLDEAIRFHLYAPVLGISPTAELPQMKPETPAQAEATAAKAREAEPGLLAELDARFVALRAAVQRADSIVPPTPNATWGNTVLYCRFIYAAASIPRPGLGEHLWKRCIDDRDAFLDVLVRRIADLAVIPELSPAPDPTRRMPVQFQVPADLVLSPMVVPGETRAPLPWARLDAPFQKRLGERFEEAAPKLMTSLPATLAAFAASDVYLPPAAVCTAALGSYAGPLARLPASAGVAGRLQNACMASTTGHGAEILERIAGEVEARQQEDDARARDGALADARIDTVPSARCAALVGPHFPAVPGRIIDMAPRKAVYEACKDRAVKTDAMITDRHLAAAVEASRVDPDTLQAWEAQQWFAQPPGGTGWIAPGQDPSVMFRFRNAYEAVMASRRKAAASRFAAGIQGEFAVDTGIEPEAAATDCGHSYPTTGDNTFSLFWGTSDARPAPPPVDAYEARPGLTAQEAEGWIGMTCRYLHAQTLARRRSLAREAGHAAEVFQNGLKLAVPAPSGELVAIDPAKLVETAATDGLQVTFRSGGLLPGASRMTITPFGRAAPSMSGRLVDTARAGDGKHFLKIVDLAGFPDLDGPLDTVACVAMQVGQARAAGRIRIFAAGTAAFFGDSFILAGMMEDEAQQDLLDVGACAASKRAFLHGEASR